MLHTANPEILNTLPTLASKLLIASQYHVMAPWLPKNIWNPYSQVAWGESKQRSPLPRFCPRIPHHSSPLVNILPLGDLAYVLHIFLAQFYQIIKFLFGTQATRQVPACCMDILIYCSAAQPLLVNITQLLQVVLCNGYSGEIVLGYHPVIQCISTNSTNSLHKRKTHRWTPLGFPLIPPTGNPGNLDPISPASSVSQ